MANQQVYQAYPQNKGTLMPGQTISVNNYTVQVERYLSQGGFAHVYLVRTPTPVYNTTHHVLKRIAVASESMLTEVKKEVDIMRLLKGHPNIVHLIDAAWHKLPNGTFEVFILMEYCPGGGIIDMMNRRLRERLTEAEILQIFVDVCEGVAYMHNSRPPLLHRDLKVENILQSSPTSFKLCDFGSATTVPNPPTNMQEIRALEADLNRHTTLQYRAPEMVDVYSKRPVNEKSDVWALGVLLYKLCYYTTPFEEHGPLAILNVQYRIPPYPVYSQDMNMLIGSMLREHGAQRPTVFEILNHVHRLRGTKSKFSYNVPIPPPLLARPHVPPKSPSNPLEDVITYRTAPTQSAISLYDPKLPPNTPAVNQGIQAREKVLEAIAPMRRGRPVISQSSSSRPSSPQKSSHAAQKSREKVPDWLDRGFETEKDKFWKSATEETAAQGATSAGADDAWNIKDFDKPPPRTETKEKDIGFGDDFGDKLWNSLDPNHNVPLPPRLSPRPNQTKLNDIPITPTPLAFTGSSMLRPKADRLLQNRDKDAFEGLGLTSSAPKNPPTLGEARKLRTGLATMSAGFSQDNKYRDAGRPNGISARHPPSPQPNYLSPTSLQTQTQSLSPVPTPGSGSGGSIFRHPQHSPSVPSPSPSAHADGHIESRFPSVEELDAQFSPPPSSVNALYPASVNDASSSYLPPMSRKSLANRPQYQPSSRTTNLESSSTVANLLRPSAPSSDGVRSLQVTGTAMRESKENRRFDDEQDRKPPTTISRDDNANIPPPIKPVATRKQRSSVIPPINFQEKDLPIAPTPSTGNLEPPKLPRRPVATTQQPRDWLTGEDVDDEKAPPPTDVVVLRDSPRKRASFIETSDFTIPAPSAATQDVIVPEPSNNGPSSADLSPTVSNFKRAFPAIEIDTTQHNNYPNGVTDQWSSVATRGKAGDVDSSSGDEGPEDAIKRPTTKRREAARAKGRQSSVHELVSQYGGRVSTSTVGKDREDQEQKEKDRRKEKDRDGPLVNSSAGDYKPHRTRPSGVGLPASTPASDAQPTVQPTSMLPTRSTKLLSIPLNDKPTPPPIGKKPSSPARSRPQSMFIFPSKSTDSSTSPTTNLMPPQEPKPRATRRTSISDMVQLYEAIGNTTGLPTGPPSPIHRPVSTKALVGSGEKGRPYKPFAEKPKSISSTASLSADSRPDEDPAKPRAAANDFTRSTTNLSRTPTKVHRKATVDVDKSQVVRSSSPDRTAPRTRRISSKVEPSRASHSRSETTTSVTVGTAKTTTLPEPLKSNSPRKPPISLLEENSTKPNERPPSPERPYQGVGRLIDQWQKKSAESEPSRPVGKIMTKRPTVIRNDDR